MRPSKLAALALISLTGPLAACGDAPVAPDPSGELGALTASARRSPTGVGRLSFTVNPGAPLTVRLGDHTISFPAGSICDPERTRYGRNQWDRACVPLKKSITIRATWWSDADTRRAVIDFQPALRFVPGADSSRWVVLSLKDRDDALALARRDYKILWYDDGRWVDESVDDPTMRTTADPRTGLISRRLKHFSGYMVSAGRDGKAATTYGGGQEVGSYGDYNGDDDN
jgi:hypothetical protein